MKISIFSFTQKATLQSLALAKKLDENGHRCNCYTTEALAVFSGLTAFAPSLKEQVACCFSSEDALIFISACGIAVRSIAPFLKSKKTDPCVLVLDEKTQFVISLLSGHLGGGNELALETAELLCATPIISTATDLNHKFAVDLFAKKNQLYLSDFSIAKQVSADLLADLSVGITSIFPLPQLPKGLVSFPFDPFISEFSSFSKNSENRKNSENNPLTVADHPIPNTGICISYHALPKDPFPKTLYLYPKQFVLGIGCRLGTSFEQLQSFICHFLAEHSISSHCLAAITSIELKRDEKGLQQLAEFFDVPFLTFSKEELLTIPGSFTASEFVRSITGVDNVCERAALAFRKDSTLCVPKTPQNGMTAALAQFSCELTFNSY